MLDAGSIEFLDKEVFTDLTGGERHEVDLVVRARFREQDAFFLIHVENQARREQEFGNRMFRYFARLHEKFGLPVYPVALFSCDTPLGPEVDRYEVRFPDQLVLAFHYRVIQLNQLNWRDFIRRPNPVAAALMTKMKIAPEDRPRLTLECLRMIVSLKLDLARSALIRDFMSSHLALTAEEEEEVYNQQVESLDPSEKRPIVDLLDVWTLKGMHRKAIETAVRLLERRFGTLPPEMRDTIEQMPDAKLDELTDAILEFGSMADARAWVKGHR